MAIQAYKGTSANVAQVFIRKYSIYMVSGERSSKWQVINEKWRNGGMEE